MGGRRPKQDVLTTEHLANAWVIRHPSRKSNVAAHACFGITRFSSDTRYFAGTILNLS
jgi:hypothetical protein